MVHTIYAVKATVPLLLACSTRTRGFVPSLWKESATGKIQRIWFHDVSALCLYDSSVYSGNSRF